MAGTGKMQNEAETSSSARKLGTAQTITGAFEKTEEPSWKMYQ